jgi:hypothetical protein
LRWRNYINIESQMSYLPGEGMLFSSGCLWISRLMQSCSGLSELSESLLSRCDSSRSCRQIE